MKEQAVREFHFRRLSALRSFSSKVWADAYLLALASVAGLQLVTFDHGFRARGAEVHIP